MSKVEKESAHERMFLFDVINVHLESHKKEVGELEFRLDFFHSSFTLSSLRCFYSLYTYSIMFIYGTLQMI